MGLEAWGEWAAVLTILSIGFGSLYAKVSSIATQVKGLVLQMSKDYEEHLRMWKVLDAIPVITTKTDSLIDKVEGLIKSDRERLTTCTRHAAEMENVQSRLTAIAER